MNEPARQKRRRRSYSEEQKQELVEAYRRRSIPQKEFCQVHGVSVSSVWNWARRRKGGDGNVVKAPDFIEVPMAGKSAPLRNQPGVELAFEKGAVSAMRIEPGVDVKWVGQLVQVIRCGG